LSDIRTLYEFLLQDKKNNLKQHNNIYQSTLKKAETLLKEQPNSQVAKGLVLKYGKLSEDCIIKLAKVRKQLSILKRGEQNDRQIRQAD